MRVRVGVGVGVRVRVRIGLSLDREYVWMLHSARGKKRKEVAHQERVSLLA